MDTEIRYPTPAHNGIYWSIQGEGHLSGVQMAFIRLAGCSVGCPQCDTDYSHGNSWSVLEIISRLREICPQRKVAEPWVWITGGEPTDHNLYPLIRALRDEGYYVAVATSGHRPMLWPVDWLSVSPHSPDKWVQRFGNEIKIVPGLNGLSLLDWSEHADEGEFWFRYVMPLSTAEHPHGKPAQIGLIKEWIKNRPAWGITMQHHKAWGLD